MKQQSDPGGGMFGINDQNNKNDDTVPAMGPVTDDMVSDDSSQSSAPAFDGSNVSLPSQSDDRSQSEDDAPAAPAADHQDVLSHNGSDDLLKIKQDALHELSPLVDHLDQTPEEKFRTTMMMIQASDDQSLLQTAYDAARAIEDDKVRAQALLDVINEINYFTQQSAK